MEYSFCFANPNVPGLMQALIGPSTVTIPMAIVLSMILVKARYNFQQIFSVVVILAGLIVAFWPSIQPYINHSQPLNKAATGTLFWNMMFVLGSVPSAVLNVYEEKAFSEQPIHMAHLLAWSTLWQMLTIFISFPLDAIPGFGTASSFKDIFEHQRQAFMCLAKYPESEIPACVASASAGQPCECDLAWLYLFLFTLAYVLSSFFVLGVVKYGNATFSFIVGAISVPLTEFAFAWEWLMGANNVEALTFWNYISLAVLLIGVIMYRIFDRKVHQAHSNTDVKLYYESIKNNDGKFSTTEPIKSLRASVMPGYSTIQMNLFVKTEYPELNPNAEATSYYTYP